jgi:hypothetical protein
MVYREGCVKEGLVSGRPRASGRERGVGRSSRGRKSSDICSDFPSEV